MEWLHLATEPEPIELANVSSYGSNHEGWLFCLRRWVKNHVLSFAKLKHPRPFVASAGHCVDCD
jgi:hypothetical protein